MTTDEIKQLATEYAYCCRYENDENACDEARLKLCSAIDEMAVKPKWATFNEWKNTNGEKILGNHGQATYIAQQAWEAARE